MQQTVQPFDGVHTFKPSTYTGVHNLTITTTTTTKEEVNKEVNNRDRRKKEREREMI